MKAAYFKAVERDALHEELRGAHHLSVRKIFAWRAGRSRWSLTLLVVREVVAVPAEEPMTGRKSGQDLISQCRETGVAFCRVTAVSHTSVYFLSGPGCLYALS